MAGVRNTKQRAVRQEALREQLAAQGHIQHVIDIINKVSDENCHIETEMVARYKIAIDAKLKLINKYCPDLKQAEIVGEDGGPLEFITRIERHIVHAKD